MKDSGRLNKMGRTVSIWAACSSSKDAAGSKVRHCCYCSSEVFTVPLRLLLFFCCYCSSSAVTTLPLLPVKFLVWPISPKSWSCTDILKWKWQICSWGHVHPIVWKNLPIISCCWERRCSRHYPSEDSADVDRGGLQDQQNPTSLKTCFKLLISGFEVPGALSGLSRSPCIMADRVVRVVLYTWHWFMLYAPHEKNRSNATRL